MRRYIILFFLDLNPMNGVPMSVTLLNVILYTCNIYLWTEYKIPF